MTLELLLLTPYAAIGASLLLVITVAMTCHRPITPVLVAGS